MARIALLKRERGLGLKAGARRWSLTRAEREVVDSGQSRYERRH